MNKLSRIDIAYDLLSEAYTWSDGVKNVSQTDVIYEFLINHPDDFLGINKILCTNHDINEGLLRVYKKDASLIVLLDGYEYLRYLDVTTSITDFELRILTELDNLQFTFTNVYAYFNDADNSEKIKKLLERYYEYVDKGNEFEKKCRSYNYEHQTRFRNALTAYVNNVESVDLVAMLFDELDTKYQTQLNRLVSVEDDFAEEEYDVTEEYEAEEEFDEDEYQLAVDEVFVDYEESVEQIVVDFQNELYSKIRCWLSENFNDKRESDEFIGFLISYAYAMICNDKKNGRLLKEEEVLLKLIEGAEVLASDMVEQFYSNKEYLFVVLDIVTKNYYEKNMDMFEMRDQIKDSCVLDKICMLDEYYSIIIPSATYKMISTELYEYYDMFFMKYKTAFPGSYLEQIFETLFNETEAEVSLYELGIDGDTKFHCAAMIRYFTRKFFEKVYIEPLGVALEEVEAFLALNQEQISLVDVVKNFSKHGIVILKGYEKMLQKGDAELKRYIREFKSKARLKILAQIDPMSIGDATYYRALNDSLLYQSIENNGLEKMVQSLVDLGKFEYQAARTFVNEIIVTIYNDVYNKQNLDSIEQTIRLLFELDSADIAGYIKMVLNDAGLIYQLLLKYYSIEKDKEFPEKYEDMLAKYPKVKQKLSLSSAE